MDLASPLCTSMLSAIYPHSAMASGIAILLRKIVEGRTDIYRPYVRDRTAPDVPDDLLYAIRIYVQDLQSALDWTATAVKDSLLGRTPRSWAPYFPLAKSPTDFPADLEKQLKGLAATHPDVAAAFERHQPYQPAKSELGYLHALAKVNKHQDFTAQTATPFQWREVKTPFGTFGFSAAAIKDDDTVDIHLADGRTMKYTLPPAETLYDWFFVDPPVRVLETLDVLGTQVRLAVEDIRHEAGV